MYAPLYIKTNNSLLESMIRIEELIEFAKVNNIKALTITDNRMYGVMEFYKACLASNINPIIGLAVIINNLKIVLYCKNNNGYKNLIKLATLISEKEVLYDDLNKYSDDTICIIPFDSITLYQSLEKIYKDIFKSYKNIDERNNLDGNNLVYMNETLYINKK